MIKINGINPLDKDIVFISNFSKTAKDTMIKFFNMPENRIKNNVIINIDDFLNLPRNQSIINNKILPINELDNNFYIIFIGIKELSKEDLGVISDVVRLTPPNNHNYIIIVYTDNKEFDITTVSKIEASFKNTSIIEYKKGYYTSDYTYEIKFTHVKDRKDTPDYCYLLGKGASKKTRTQFNAGDIWLNGAVCKHCGDFIRSKNVHDFKMCKCGKVGVDGGSFYIRRIGNPEDYFDVVEKFSDV